MGLWGLRSDSKILIYPDSARDARYSTSTQGSTDEGSVCLCARNEPMSGGTEGRGVILRGFGGVEEEEGMIVVVMMVVSGGAELGFLNLLPTTTLCNITMLHGGSENSQRDSQPHHH